MKSIENDERLIYNVLVMKKSFILLLTISLCLLCFTGCSMSKDDDKNNIFISSDGQISERIREPFGENYYDIEELKQSVLEEVAAYNTSSGAGISLERVKLNDKTTDIEIQYQNCKEFSEFNGEVLFVGAPSEAVAQGYDLKAILTDVSDPSKTITTADIIGMEDYTLVIFNYAESIFLPEKVKYKSDNCQLAEPNKVILNPDSSEIAYILYK